MKREKKFRFWDKKSLRMYDGDMLFINDHSDNGTASINATIRSIQDRYEIMDYIGLKDKKGVEIYEGDILECGEDKPVLVKWNNYLSSFGVKKECWLYMHFFGEAIEPTQCTVIGNIHQHPHLLKAATA